MAHRTLTDRTLKALKGKEKPYDVKDTEVRGLRVRVMPSGQCTFVLLTRFPGSSNPTRRALGTYGVLNLQDAREKAAHWRKLVKAGVDPSHEEERHRAAQLQKQATTFASVAEDFIKERLTSQRKGFEVARDLRRVFGGICPEDEYIKNKKKGDLVGAWASRPIADITPLEVRNIIKQYKDAAKLHQAHNLLSYARRLFNWAIDQHVYGLETSPCNRLKPYALIGEKRLRTRILSDAELRAAWQATDKLGYPYGPLLRLLILTGQRKSEVAEARWAEFDLVKKVWTIPPERIKADAAHVVPLCDDAIKILQSLPRFQKGDCLFSTTFGKKPVNGFANAKILFDREILKALREDDGRAMLPDFVIHDLRRTVRTALSAIPNISDLVRELVIGHTKPGLHKVYDQYAYLDEKRSALDAWAARLRSIVDPPAVNVISLARA